jgi:hypothetical protein
MAGLDPAIHVFLAVVCKDVDARDKPGHDEVLYGVVVPYGVPPSYDEISIKLPSGSRQ